MYQATLPISEFYNNCLTSAKNAGYKILLCLVAREADAGGYYKEVTESWSSLHDLTGSLLLFIFAGCPPKELIEYSGIQHKREPVVFKCPSIAVSWNSRLAISNIRVTRDMLRMATPFPKNKEELHSYQTLQIAELKRALNLYESDIPCLHFTYLFNNEREIIPLDDLKNKGIGIYDYLKIIVEQCEHSEKNIARLKQSLDKINKKLDRRNDAQWRFKSGLNHEIRKIREYCINSTINDEDKQLFREILAILNNEELISIQDRKKYYVLINSVKYSPNLKWNNYRRGLMRAIDLHKNYHSANHKNQDSSDLKEKLKKYRTEIEAEYKNIQLSTLSSLIGIKMNALKSNFNDKCKILFLSANPAGTSHLMLDKEVREIEWKLKTAKFRDSIEFIPKGALRPDDLLQYLNENSAQIIHFSGHGTKSEELMLIDGNNMPKPVSKIALVHLFKILKGNIKVVLLNACYSRPQAEAITSEIDIAIGMKKAIGDNSAIIFATSFYRAISFGKSVKEAFDQGITALLLENVLGHDIPELIVKDGVNPNEIRLVADV